jgi:hypothetical protein
VEATINKEIKEVDELRSLLQVYVLYVEVVVNTSGTTIPFTQETTVLLLCVILQSRQNDSYLQIIANMPLIYYLVYAAENFLRASIYFLLVVGICNRD